ncbi:MAG TPA: hypothetical protein VNZ58_00540 [Thermomicrobiales bacterium]|nr:hypothetical protein [Thermomicrobiales bacterium]
MNRRAFIASAAAAMLLPRLAQSGNDEATPSPTPHPAPIDLGEGITLTDYRVYPGERPAILGEIRNDRSEMVDSPVIGLNWPDAQGFDRFSWASPILPTIGPDETVPIFGILPETDDGATLLETASFTLCSAVGPGEYTAKQQAMTLKTRVTYERYRPLAFRGTGIVLNAGDTLAVQVAVRGIVRDRDDRIAGVTPAALFASIRPGRQKEFNVWVGQSLQNKANPVPLISGVDYSVDIRIGPLGPVVAPGCTLDRPWE